MSAETDPGRDWREPRRRPGAASGRLGPPSRLEDLDDTLKELAASPALVSCDVHTVAVTEPEPVDLRSALADALARPLDSPSLRALAADATSAVIITSDATRAVPNRDLLPVIVAELTGAGVRERDITVVIGVGAHRPMHPDERVAHLGEWAGRLRVVNHDAKATDLVRIGATHSGNELLLDRWVWEADLRVALGQVEQHEFAGFTGGPKAILPGVAGYDTILRNHSLAMLRHPLARPGILEGNPVHDEMVDAARLARLDFVVNVVMDRSLRPLAVAAGDPGAVKTELCGFIRSFAEVDPPIAAEDPHEAPDLVVTGPGRPLDTNLYQTVKALVGVEPLVGPETTILLVSSCTDGTGGRDWLLPFTGAADSEDVLQRLEDEYTVQRDHSYFVARFQQRCPSIVVCCPGVDDEDLRRLFLEPARDVREGLGRARRLLRSRRARPYVLLFPRPQRALLPLELTLARDLSLGRRTTSRGTILWSDLTRWQRAAALANRKSRRPRARRHTDGS